jgi:hypothetical protein
MAYAERRARKLTGGIMCRKCAHCRETTLNHNTIAWEIVTSLSNYGLAWFEVARQVAHLWMHARRRRHPQPDGPLDHTLGVGVRNCVRR